MERTGGIAEGGRVPDDPELGCEPDGTGLSEEPFGIVEEAAAGGIAGALASLGTSCPNTSPTRMESPGLGAFVAILRNPLSMDSIS